MRSVIVSRIRRLSRLLPAAALLALGLGPAAAPALAAAHQAPAVTHKTVTHKTVTAAGAETLTGTLPDGATYLIQVPANWNGTLFLYSHGYVVPGSPNPATDVGDPITGAAMLAQGFALAGSSYASTGWAIQQALPDQISTLNIFDSQVGHPKRTIAWGHSLGGIITAGLIQKYPSRFAGALPMCGVLSGGVATWNTALDSEFAFQQLIDPSVQVVNITIPPTDPTANLTAADTAAVAAPAPPPPPPRPRRAGDPARAGAARARRRARRHAWLVHPAVPRARRERLCRPGSQPVRMGDPGRLPVRLLPAGRARGPGGRQPVLEHRRELLQGLAEVSRLP
jgi:pimeloyl-ACP methyl ester carboxylesterase